MTKTQRIAGRQLRTVAKLDRTWRAEGKVEGRTENRLAMELGRAARMGLGRESRRMQSRNAAALGTTSGWE